MNDRPRSLAARLGSLLACLGTLAAGTLVTAVVVALLGWLPAFEGVYWPQVASFWSSWESVPFWVAVAALNLIAALLVPPEPPWAGPHPGVGFSTGVVYGVWLLVRQALAGASLPGLLALRWPEVLGLGIALAAGSWAMGLAYPRWCPRR